MILYGSGMSNSNLHNILNLPVLLAGGGAGRLPRGQHIRYPEKTPLTNLYMSVLGSVAYGSYLWLLKASTPAKAATYAYVNPVIALLLGHLLGDESLSAWTMSR